MPDAQRWEASVSSSVEGLQAALHQQLPCCLVALRLSCPSAPTGKGEEHSSLTAVWREAKRHLLTYHKEQLLCCCPSCCWKWNPTSQLSTNSHFPFLTAAAPTCDILGPTNSSTPLSLVSYGLLPGLRDLAATEDTLILQSCSGSLGSGPAPGGGLCLPGMDSRSSFTVQWRWHWALFFFHKPPEQQESFHLFLILPKNHEWRVVYCLDWMSYWPRTVTLGRSWAITSHYCPVLLLSPSKKHHSSSSQLLLT